MATIPRWQVREPAKDLTVGSRGPVAQNGTPALHGFSSGVELSWFSLRLRIGVLHFSRNTLLTSDKYRTIGAIYGLSTFVLLTLAGRPT